MDEFESTRRFLVAIMGFDANAEGYCSIQCCRLYRTTQHNNTYQYFYFCILLSAFATIIDLVSHTRDAVVCSDVYDVTQMCTAVVLSERGPSSAFPTLPFPFNSRISAITVYVCMTPLTTCQQILYAFNGRY